MPVFHTHASYQAGLIEVLHCRAGLESWEGQGGRSVRLTHLVRTNMCMGSGAWSHEAEGVNPEWVWQREVKGHEQGLSGVSGQGRGAGGGQLGAQVLGAMERGG